MQRIKQCKVCGAKEHVGFHYGVCTCRACGSFFRRHLESEYEWKYNKCQCSPKKLSKENEDEKSPTDLTKCKKCRLEKCFSVGMKKLDVGYLRQDLCQEVIKGSKEIELFSVVGSSPLASPKSNRGLAIGLIAQPRDYLPSNHSIVDITINDQKLIDSILPIIEAKKRITHAFNDLDDIFLKGPIFFEEIISSNFNILRLVDIFSPNPSPMPLDELKRWESSLQNEGLLNTRCRKAFQVNRLLCFGIAKSMPVFEKLTLSDQVLYESYF
uniref:Nuclear receptor domain-containing protein n=1 Tax=Meloidogyne incognita TaxID=6306 RepID=A0A914LZA0_MELIC